MSRRITEFEEETNEMGALSFIDMHETHLLGGLRKLPCYVRDVKVDPRRLPFVQRQVWHRIERDGMNVLESTQSGSRTHIVLWGSENWGVWCVG
jgi:hypothetical protein